MNSIRFHNSYSPYVVRRIAAGGVGEALALFEARAEPDDAIAALD
jgi:hypothetical protein